MKNQSSSPFSLFPDSQHKTACTAIDEIIQDIKEKFRKSSSNIHHSLNSVSPHVENANSEETTARVQPVINSLEELNCKTIRAVNSAEKKLIAITRDVRDKIEALLLEDGEAVSQLKSHPPESRLWVKQQSDRTIDIATDPGDAERTKTYAYASPDRLALVHGLTEHRKADGSVDSGCATECIFDAETYAQRLGTAITNLAENRDLSLKEVVKTAIFETTRLHHPDCLTGHPLSPAATVAIVRVDKASRNLEYFVLGEAYLLYRPEGSETIVITDRRAGAAGRELRNQYPFPPFNSPHYLETLRLRARAQGQVRNVPGGFPIATDKPEAADNALAGTFDLPAGGKHQIAVATHAATREFTFYKETDLNGFMDLLQEQGSKGAIQHLRGIEIGNTTTRRPHKSGDATIIYQPDVLGA